MDPEDEQLELDPIALLKITLSLDEVIGDPPLESGSTKLHVKSARNWKQLELIWTNRSTYV